MIYLCSKLPFGGLIQELLGKTLPSDKLLQFSTSIRISTGHYNSWNTALGPNGERPSPGASLTQKDGYGNASGEWAGKQIPLSPLNPGFKLSPAGNTTFFLRNTLVDTCQKHVPKSGCSSSPRSNRGKMLVQQVLILLPPGKTAES